LSVKDANTKESKVTFSSRIVAALSGRRTTYFLAATLLLLVAQRSSADGLEKWLQTEQAVATNKLVGNVLSNGAVIASPSRQDPDYFYHWVRDGALTMDVVATLYAQSKDSAAQGRYDSLLRAYLDFSLKNQVTQNPSSELGRGLGEPKFYTDGSAFTGAWGRPQDDGPALRALTFTRFANFLLNKGTAEQTQLVKAKLYDGVLPTNSVIKRDLEYVSHNWQNTCFDLWEEVRGHHFYTRMVQRRALLEGARLAKRLKDNGAADWYSAQAAALEKELRKHWDETRGILVATLDRDDGIDYKQSGLDTAVLLAVLHAPASGSTFFAPTDDMVLATAAQLVSVFEKAYDINKAKKDGEGAALGIALGRYPEDRYGGQQGTSEGNAWVLCTLAVGELYLRAAKAWEGEGQMRITRLNAPFFSALNAEKFGSLKAGQVLGKGDQEFRDILSELRSAADRQLRRVKYHAFPDGSLSEQMNRHTGFMQSARDLTWNYAAVLTTLSQRGPGLAADRVRFVTPASTAALNRGGIPVLDRLARRPGPDGIPAQAPRGVPGSVMELRLRVAELEATVDALTREVRALKSGKDKVAPK
jgi:glucoamylase